MDFRENSQHRHSHLSLILLSVLIGAVLTALMLAQPGRHQPMMTTATAQPAVVVNFESVADRVLPAVVYINSDIVTPVDPRQEEMRRQLEEMFRRQMPGGRPGQGTPQLPGESDEESNGTAPKARPAAGSGWIYQEDGLIVTNAHVVRGATKVTVKLHDRENDDREYPAKIIGIDPRSELAVIKIDAGRKLPTLPMGNSDDLKIASPVMAVGSPFQLQQTVTVGVISARGRIISGESEYFRLGDLIQTDASINPGNSGGPLVNARGEVIGINVAIASPGATSVPVNIGIGFAIPSNVAKIVIPQLAQSGRVARGWLGVVIKELNENLRQYYNVTDGGVLITQVNPDAPAAKQLHPNDIVLSIAGRPVRSSWDLQNAVANSAPKSRLNMEILRNKQRQQIAVELGEMPALYAGLEAEPGPAETAAPAGPPITVRNITPELAQARSLCRTEGVFIDQVGADLRDRLQRGDVIVKLDDAEIANVDAYRAAIAKATAAKRPFVVFTIERMNPDGNKMTDVVDVPLTQ
ncbi:MAG: trypsin-like peptidase domain-containing protein [Armatimonadota bacterium]